MRVTMNMTSKTYYKNLNKNYEELLKAETQSTSYRKFEKASEDPVSSIKAYRFRQEISENNSYQSNVSFLRNTLSTQESSISSIRDIADTIKSTDYLKAITGTTSASDRATIATKLRALQAAIVSDANVKFGGNYLFGGAGTSEAPFTVDENGNLLYRGIDVNTGRIAAGTSTTINGVSITLGDKTGTYDGYTIQVANGTTATPVSIDTDAKTITVTMNLFSGTKTNEDLLNTLKSSPEFAGASMTGDIQRPVTVDSAQTTTGRIGTGDAMLKLGDTTGKYNGYTVKLTNGTDNVTVDDAAKTITVSMSIGSSTTAEDVLNVLKSNFEFSNASMSGNLSMKVSGTTEIKLSSSNLPASIATNTIGQAGLKALANEKSYVDIGGGLTFDSNGNLNSQSVFNVAVPGISFLGYSSADGTGTGMSNNIYTLIDQIADLLESDDYSLDAIKPYIDHFNEQSELLSAAVTQSGTNSQFLKATETRLTTVGDNADDALDEAAYVDTVDAYQNYTTKYYGYLCALQIGTKLIESTILDYMR
jgi:flagellin-like hook-associated protein FlgL